MELEYREPTDGDIMDALEHDLKLYHAAEASRDIEDLRRIHARLARREVDVEYLYSADEQRKARKMLATVEQPAVDIPEPRQAFAYPLPSRWDDETHLQRHWPKYAAAIGGCAGVALVVWVVVQLVTALVAAVAALVAAMLQVIAGVGVILLIVLLCSLGGGGKSFSGTFQGRMH
jgi:hypothetical protein